MCSILIVSINTLLFSLGTQVDKLDMAAELSQAEESLPAVDLCQLDYLYPCLQRYPDKS